MALRRRGFRIAARVSLTLGLAQSSAAGCGAPAPATTFVLALAPDASCSGAGAVDAVDRLAVRLVSPQGATLESWDLPFDVHGSESSLGLLPREGEGRFVVRGLAPLCGAQPVEVFEGSSALVELEPAKDQRVVVPVRCAAAPSCTPAPTPVTSFAPADLVLGQPDFSTCNYGGIGAARRLREPDGLDLAGDVLWIADRGHNRVAAFPGPATLSSGQPIGYVVGHDNLTATGNGDGANDLDGPRDVAILPDRAVIADGDNHRGQIFAPTPTASGKTATFALGQNDANNDTSPNAGGAAAQDTLSSPGSVLHAGTSLFVSDRANHRVLRFPVTSLAQNRPMADLVLGQEDFVSNTPNRGGLPADDSLASPGHLATDGVRLYVADTGNDRVLVFDLATLANGAPAALVITGGGGASLLAPRGVAATPDRLVIADSGNNRVLVWEPPPASASDAPSAVLGQPDLSGTDANDGGAPGDCPTFDTCPAASGRRPTPRSLSRPGAVLLDGADVWVSDTCNSRVLRFRPERK